MGRPLPGSLCWCSAPPLALCPPPATSAAPRQRVAMHQWRVGEGGVGTGGGGGEARLHVRHAARRCEAPAPPSHGPLLPPGSRTALPARDGTALMSLLRKALRPRHTHVESPQPRRSRHARGCLQGGRGPPPSGASEVAAQVVETHQLLRTAHEDGRVHLQIHLRPPAELSPRARGGVGSSCFAWEDERRTLEHVLTASNPRSVMSLWSYSPSPIRNNTISVSSCA
jgi:hypothetical protein